MKALAIAVFILGFIALYLALTAVSALILMWAWNAVMPYLFHLPTLVFIQAWGLTWLISGFSMLFKNK